MFDKFFDLPTKWIIIWTALLMLATSAGAAGTTHLAIRQWPGAYRTCAQSLPNAVLMEAHKAPNGDILCKIIQTDSVERYVWLDGDGVVLK